MCLEKYSAIGNSAIGDYVVLCCKLILKTVLWEDFLNQLKQCYLEISAVRGSAARGLGELLLLRYIHHN